MPLQERFGARPMWACLVACPVNEITSFVVDSSRSRKSVNCFSRLHKFFANNDDLTPVAPRQQEPNSDFLEPPSRPPRASGKTPTLPFTRSPPLCSGTLPPPHNAKGQPVRSEKRGAGGVSVVTGIDVHDRRGAGLGRICVWPTLGVKEGEGSIIRFQPIKPRVSEPSNQL
jgi:hypothetical protein